ncbi:MAG: hypothetical protein ABIR47_07410, partial [Candidatus Kapaibacterium sp.]
MADTLITKWTIDTSSADAAARRISEDVSRVTATLGKPIAMHIDASGAEKELARAAVEAQKLHDTLVKPAKLAVDASGAEAAINKTKGQLSSAGGEASSGGGVNLGSLIGGAVGGAALTAGLDVAKAGLGALKDAFNSV